MHNSHHEMAITYDHSMFTYTPKNSVHIDASGLNQHSA